MFDSDAATRKLRGAVGRTTFLERRWPAPVALRRTAAGAAAPVGGDRHVMSESSTPAALRCWRPVARGDLRGARS